MHTVRFLQSLVVTPGCVIVSSTRMPLGEHHAQCPVPMLSAGSAIIGSTKADGAEKVRSIHLQPTQCNLFAGSWPNEARRVLTNCLPDLALSRSSRELDTGEQKPAPHQAIWLLRLVHRLLFLYRSRLVAMQRNHSASHHSKMCGSLHDMQAFS